MEEAGKNNDELSYLSIYVAQDCTVYSQDVLSVLGGNKSVIMLVPLRLGTNRLIKIYEPQIMYFFTMESCIGIIGGRPNHAVYFLGYQDNKLFYLDPHYCQLAFNYGQCIFLYGLTTANMQRKWIFHNLIRL
ncbi:hypothetical protein L9F63_009913, partial [Diploptera punctata]